MRKFKVVTMTGIVHVIEAKTFQLMDDDILFFWVDEESRAGFKNWDYFIEIID